jgi:hypothetical protein
MTDRTNDDAHREGSAAKRTDISDMPNRDQRRTKAGQEASNDQLPAEHDREDQSGYGGGGPNGGTNA